MNKAHVYFGVLACVLSAGVQNARAGIYQDLTPDQQNQVQAGQQVFVTQDVDGLPWPKVFIYQRIDSTPEEALAVFSDYELQKTWAPHILQSHISNHVNSRTTDVDYTIEVPIVSNENYTVRDTVSSYANGGYRVDWSLVRADTTKSSDGYAKFETLGTGTIMAYYNLVVPGSSFASFVRKKAIQAVKDAASAVVTQVQSERTNNQALLQHQLQSLRVSLNGH